MLLNDLPGNQTAGTPLGIAAIPIPFNPATTIATTTPGYRVAVYDGGDGAPGSGADHTPGPERSDVHRLRAAGRGRPPPLPVDHRQPGRR